MAMESSPKARAIPQPLVSGQFHGSEDGITGGSRLVGCLSVH